MADERRASRWTQRIKSCRSSFLKDTMKKKTKDILTKTKKKKRRISKSNSLSSGSTLLNLACTDTPYAGFLKGKYHYIVGDSASGKTFLSLTCLAEAVANKHFKDYRFIFDNAEDGALMDIERFFGKGVAERIEPPAHEDGAPVASTTIEEFFYHVDDAFKEGTPFIYILDSMDSLSSKDEQAKFTSTKEAFRKGKETTGSYGDGKAKKNSTNVRRLLTPLRESGSILIIISQTRDNIGGSMFSGKTRAGGHALRFYASIEWWSAIKETKKKTIRKKNRQIGIDCKISIKKNRFTGKLSQVTIPIYHSFGIDDVGSCVNYLIGEEHWKKKGTLFVAKEWDFSGSREQIIKHIEENSLENEMRTIVGSVWNEIQEACAVKRKKRYE